MKKWNLFFVFVLLVFSGDVYSACINLGANQYHYYCTFYTSDEASARSLCTSKITKFAPYYSGIAPETCDAQYPAEYGGDGFRAIRAGWYKIPGEPFYYYNFPYPKDENYCQEGEIDIDTGECQLPPPKTPPSCGGVGNPCQVSTGAKTQTETDFSSGLGFTRFYQTLNPVDVGLGKGWRSSFQQQLSVLGDMLYVVESSGRGDPWRKVNGVWESDVDSDYLLSETSTGFTVTGKRGDVMAYDHDGRLLSETDTNGNTRNYAYDNANRLIAVTNHYGASINLTYSTDGKNHIASVINSGNEIYRYDYDANDNLVAVIYPDATPENLADNPRRLYHYENADFPNHLTGITDENGNRYATYAYDAQGKAIATQHAQTTNAVPQERFELDYQN